MKCHVGERVMGNREVPRIEILARRADLSGAAGKARIEEEEGGSWGKDVFPHANEPKARGNGA
jgi:hypothetical protein